MCRKISLLFFCALLVIVAASSSYADTYTSNTANNHALELTSGSASYYDITVTKTGDVPGQSDNYDWQGTNAAVHASGGGTLTITGSSTISSTATYGNAVFSYGGNLSGSNAGDGTTITISGAAITTYSNNSGGIMATGGGIINASNLNITTSGGSSAAIRSDKGGGTITVSGGTYTTSGTGSPAIYCTAAITGADVTLTSNASQVVVIEGGNSVTLTGSALTANHSTLNGQDTTHQAILIYQSQSGDASDGASSFTMTNGSITNTQGDIFHVTNTTTTITLTSVDITNNDSSGYFLRAASDSWGTSGSNGGKITLNASNQVIEGNILVDSASSLTMNLTSGSSFDGAINTSSQTGTVKVNVASGTTWTLTANSHISSLTNNGTINQGSYILYVNGSAYDGTSTSAGDDSGSTTSSDTGPEITTTSLKNATVGKNYSVTLKAEGRKPIRWSSTTLPEGLSLSSSGKLSGKAEASGTYAITFTAANSDGSRSKTLSLDVSDVAPKIKVSSKSGIVNEAYTLQFSLSAGTGAITWSLTGDLPDGLSFDAENAVISGEPTQTWSKNITVTAENSAGKATKTLKLTIRAVKPSIKTKALDSGTISEDYTASFDITGTTPITLTVTGLPSGLTYSADTGQIIGTPTKYGKYNVKLKAENAGGKASKSYKLVIYAPPSISAVTLGTATAGKSYSKKFKAEGSTPITWSVEDGTLPDGMTLNAKTGILKGKPALDGSYDITIIATNSSGSDSMDVNLNVKAVAPKLSGNLKKGTAGKAYSSTLRVKGTAPITWTVSGDLPDGIEFSDGTFSGMTEKYFKGNIVVTVTHGTLSDSGTYTIEMKSVAPKITTKTLASGTVGTAYSETLEATGTPDITWSWSGYPSGLTLNSTTGEIAGTPTKAGTYRIKFTAENDARSVNRTIRLVINEAANTMTREDGVSEDEWFYAEEYYISTDELPEGFVIVAELPEVSVDFDGQTVFEVTLSNDAPIGAKLFWVANADKPSEDNAIADFYDVEGKYIEAVPEDRKILVAPWLNKGVIYRPVIAVKKQ